jgi:heme-degrading monooxygenase HmoA
VAVILTDGRHNSLRWFGEVFMIARHWRGWTRLNDAEAYEKLLKETVLPGLKAIEGYRGGYVLRNDESEQAEFVVVNFFDSLDAVKRFSGPDYAVAVFEPEAKKLLSRIEPTAMHYEVRVSTV